MRPVPGYGDYHALRDGRIWDARRGRFLRLSRHPAGHREVGLRDGSGGFASAKVHRLVARAWLPNPQGHHFVVHRNTEKANDRVDNLAWSRRPPPRATPPPPPGRPARRWR